MFGDPDEPPSDPRFEEWYGPYPRHEAKEDARKAFGQLKPGAALFRTMMNDVAARKLANWQGREKNKIPLPATYIRGQRWKDELYNNGNGNGAKPIERSPDHGRFAGIVKTHRGSKEGE